MHLQERSPSGIQNVKTFSIATTGLNCSRISNVVMPEIGLGKRGLLEKEFLEILENPQTVEDKRASDHLLEILEYIDLGYSRDSSSEKTPFVMTPFSGPEETSLIT